MIYWWTWKFGLDLKSLFQPKNSMIVFDLHCTSHLENSAFWVKKIICERLVDCLQNSPQGKA